jgi:hypothetical protein
MFRLAGLVDHHSFGVLSASTRSGISTFNSWKQRRWSSVAVRRLLTVLLSLLESPATQKNSSDCEQINALTHTLLKDPMCT